MTDNKCTHCELDFSADDVHVLGHPTSEEVRQFVTDKWPAAKHEGVGYWRIPRTAHVWASGAHSNGTTWVTVVRYEAMGRHAA